MTVLTTLAPVLAVTSLDLCGLAKAAGWRQANSVRPDELLCGAAMLQLAGQPLAVRMVVHTGTDMGPLLELLAQDVQRTLIPEQFIVLVDFPTAAIRTYQARFQPLAARRVTVGSPEDYRSWLQARLGPVGKLPLTSPLRGLTEHLLCFSSAPEPRQKRPVAGSFQGRAIQPSFELGQLGVQAIESLFAYTRGSAGVVNVEDDPSWQTQDVDLRISDPVGGQVISVEVKNENKDTGNIVLEKYSCFEHRTPGWLGYSSADVLVSCLWPTGDVLLMDLVAVREWVLTTERKLRLVLGTVPEQNYHSQVYLAPINALLEDLPGAIHLRVQEWLPTLYAGTFVQKSLVKPHLGHKTLRPQRPVAGRRPIYG